MGIFGGVSFWVTFYFESLLILGHFDFESHLILGHFIFWVTFDLESVGIFGGVCFLTFCVLRLLLGFWILRGHLSLIFEF